MLRCRILFIILLIAVSMSQVSFMRNSQPTIQRMNQMPLAFTQNNGQWDERVLFRANTGGATMWFTKEGVTYQFTRRIPPSPLPREGEGRSRIVGQDRFGPDTPGLAGTAPNDPIPLLRGVRGVSEPDSIEQLVLTAKFIGANPNPEVVAEGQMEYKCNYFLGNDPTKWHTDVPNYEAITLKDIYPGIDVRYSSDGTGQAAYEFVVAPGADVAQVRVAYEGAEQASLDAEGRLVLKTKWGDMVAAINSPRPLGKGPGERVVLSPGKATFSQLSEKTIGFETNVSSQQALSISSVGLVYSTYLGGSGRDYGEGIAVDVSGNAYVTGRTCSSNFPTQNPFQATTRGNYDVFVTKLSSSGNSLIYSTYLGGLNDNTGYSIAVDGCGNAYVTGRTSSSDFPILNPFQTYQGGSDAFVVKLSSSGNNLIYSTYLGGGSEGGGGDDAGFGIAVDDSGNAYVTGEAGSTNFPTLSPYQATYQGGAWGDAFATKFSSSGNSIIYSTYLGGECFDFGYGIAVDDSGNAYVTGWTCSANFPILNSYQATYQGSQDAFVTKLSNSGNSLIYSTYLGGGSNDEGFGIAVDDSGNAFVAGLTASSDFPTLNPYQAAFQGGESWGDAFVTKLSSSGNSILYSTYLGGAGNEGDLFMNTGGAIAIDGSGNAYVTGVTHSSDFPTLNPYQTDPGDGTVDAFVAKLGNAGSSLIYSTYLGGGVADYGTGIAVDDSGNAYVTGYTASSNFPTWNPYQTHQGPTGYQDVFVTKLSWAPDYICGDADGSGQIDISDAVYLVAYIFGDGPEPLPFKMNGDVDCSGQVDISDAVYLVNYIFGDGPAPCVSCK